MSIARVGWLLIPLAVTAACSGAALEASTPTRSAAPSTTVTPAPASPSTPQFPDPPMTSPAAPTPGPASTSDPTPTTDAPTTTAAPRRTVTVVAGGDVLNERLVNDAGDRYAAPGERFDFAPVFAPVAPLIAAADLAICHLELPVGAPTETPGVKGRSPIGGNLLLAPFEIVAGLRATGFDRCSTASNHSFDLGVAGVSSTLDALDANGLGHDGTARTSDEAALDPASLVTVGGIRVAHLSYTRFWNTDRPNEPWILRWVTTPQQVADDVAAVRAAGAEIVIVSLHIAKEMLSEPLGGDRSFVTELTASAPIDLIVQHGPHVVQPVEVVNGTPVYWSLGNFVSGMGVPGTGKYEDPRTLDGLLARVRFTELSPGVFAAEYDAIAICNERSSRTVHAAVSTLGQTDAATSLPDPLRAELERCAARISEIVDDVS